MKQAIVLLLLGILLYSTGTVFSQPRDISGTWSMICCDGKHRGEIEIIQTGGMISGRFRDLQGNDTGSLSGVIQGNRITFARIFDGRKRQSYSLTLGADGQSMTGVLGGDRDRSVGVDVKCIRKSNPNRNFISDFVKFSPGSPGTFIGRRGAFTKKVLETNGRLPLSIRRDLSNRSSIGFLIKKPSVEGHHYLTLNSLGKSPLSPSQIMALIMRNPDRVFPFFNASGTDGQSIKMGNIYSLRLPYDITGRYENRVKVTGASPYSFTFKTTDEHQLQGSATHGIFRDETGELWLFQEGVGVRNETERLQQINYAAANVMWGKMAGNVKSLMSDVSKPAPRKYKL